MSTRVPPIPLLAGLALLSPAASVAQSTICNSVSNNTAFDTLTSMGGPNLLVALKAKAATVLVATRAEVWTGEAAGTNSIALWSHDPIGDKPAQALSTASWSMSIEISLSTSIDVTGQANLSVGVPNLASLVGQAIYTQWVVLDPLANGLQLVVSNGGKGSVGT